MKVHSAFSLQVAAAAIPSLILLSVVPIIRDRLTLDAFAGFSVLVSVIGLLSILDGGLGRAVTYFVSITQLKEGTSRARAVLLGGMVVGTGFSILVMLTGIVLLGFVTNESFVTARDAIYVLLVFCPAFVAGSVLKGALEGQQRFIQSSALQVAYGALIGVGPIVLIAQVEDLPLYAWFVGVARIGLAAAFLYTTGILTPKSRRVARFVGVQANRIFHYSKWLFFSNVVGLCIIFADRFVIATQFKSSIVAAYLLPMELIARGQVLVGAFCSVVFPKLVTHVQRPTQRDVSGLVGDIQGIVIGATVVMGFVCLPLMEPMMGWWLGQELAPQAATIALVGIVGLALVSGASISMLAINGMGHTRQVAILHAAELPLYLSLLYLATLQGSLDLLLAAWIFRLSLDVLGMEAILGSLIKQSGDLHLNVKKTVRRWLVLLALIGALLTLIFVRPHLSSQSVFHWAALGAAVSVVALIGFGLRLRNTILATPSMPSVIP